MSVCCGYYVSLRRDWKAITYKVVHVWHVEQLDLVDRDRRADVAKSS